jgi:phage terminase Nu1 subunit (DNA packaging protein)
MAMTPQDWTISGLSVETGIDRRTLGKMLKDAKPVGRRGKSDLYRIEQVITALRGSSGGDYNEERTRLTKAQADHEELKVAQLAGELIPVDFVIETWQAQTQNMRAKLLNLPTKAAQAAIAARELKDIEDVIRDQVHEALTELSDDGIPEDTRKRLESNCKETGSASEADRKPVGGQVQKTKPGSQCGTGPVEN